MTFSKKSLYAVIALFFLALVSYYALIKSREQLIPRSILFGNPERAAPSISPDGKSIAFIAPLNGVLNIFTQDLEGDSKKEPITNDTHRGIRDFFWAYDSRSLFYMQDTDGNEDWRIYSIDCATKEAVCLTPELGVSASVVAYMKQYPNFMLISMNKRDPKYNDIYRLDLTTKKLDLVTENTGAISSWIPDKQLAVRGALEAIPGGGYKLLYRETEKSPWRAIREWDPQDASGLGVMDFTKDGKFFILGDAKGADKSRLLRLDIATGATEVIFQDPDYDAVSGLLMDEDTFELLAIETEREKASWTVFAPRMQEHFKILEKLDYGCFSFLSRDTSQTYYIVGYSKDNGPISYWLYNTSNKKGTFLFDNKPKLKNYTLATIEPFMCTARDGLILHGYITYPPHKERKNLPMVLHVHGGPWTRDSWGYSPVEQWLANRGYAVLQVNYRGSTGYGKNFVNAANRQWSGAMHTDLLDAVNWAVVQGAVDPKKIGIYGGSYGGYAALVGAAFTPDVFACAIDVVGPSNLITLIETVPPYWATEMERFYKQVGHPVYDKQFLIDCSPLFKVKNIKIPLLIAQGAKDPRVKQSEAEQIVAALKENNIPYTYMLFEDEGHGFVRPENREKFFAEMEKFLATHLGGMRD